MSSWVPPRDSFPFKVRILPISQWALTAVSSAGTAANAVRLSLKRDWNKALAKVGAVYQFTKVHAYSKRRIDRCG